jgi:N-ethylmaleimide reductase
MTDLLFTPIRLGALDLPNLDRDGASTRSRAAAGNVPSDLAIEYYRQRASAGLIITEGTQISAQGQGYAWTPAFTHRRRWKAGPGLRRLCITKAGVS